MTTVSSKPIMKAIRWFIFAVLLNTLLCADIQAGTTFYVVRHGQRDWNKKKRKQGQTNTPLNAQGKAEAAELAVLLQDVPFTYCYSSDLDRA